MRIVLADAFGARVGETIVVALHFQFSTTCTTLADAATHYGQELRSLGLPR